jgi:hypothetical protein
MFQGGDISLLFGIIFLVLTAPFGPIWWFYIYPAIASSTESQLLQYSATIVILVLAYLFWFKLVSQIMRGAGTAKNAH